MIRFGMRVPAAVWQLWRLYTCYLLSYFTTNMRPIATDEAWSIGLCQFLCLSWGVVHGSILCDRSNPTHQLTDPTQHNPLRMEKFGPKKCLKCPEHHLSKPARKPYPSSSVASTFDADRRGWTRPNLSQRQPNPWVNPTRVQL